MNSPAAQRPIGGAIGVPRRSRRHVGQVFGHGQRTARAEGPRGCCSRSSPRAVRPSLWPALFGRFSHACSRQAQVQCCRRRAVSSGPLAKSGAHSKVMSVMVKRLPAPYWRASSLSNQRYSVHLVALRPAVNGVNCRTSSGACARVEGCSWPPRRRNTARPGRSARSMKAEAPRSSSGWAREQPFQVVCRWRAIRRRKRPSSSCSGHLGRGFGAVGLGEVLLGAEVHIDQLDALDAPRLREQGDAWRIKMRCGHTVI